MILLTPAHPYRGGIAASSERLAQELQASGYSVLIYTFTLQYPGFLFPGKTQYSNDPAPEGLRIERRIHALNPLNWWRIGRELYRKKPDLLIIRYWLPFMAPCLGSILRLARRNGHTHSLCIADNIIPHEKRPGDTLLTRYLVGAVDSFIVMSRSVGTELRQFSQQVPYHYVPHPIYDNYGELAERNPALKQLGLDAHFRYLLFFGFIRGYKGLDLLLDALADQRLGDQPIRLIIAGEFYDDEAAYREQIERLGLQDRVILFSSYIPHEDVRWYFGAADLVVQPYRSATQSGISQLAYHFEKPMVVTRVGGLPEIVSHNESGYVTDIDPAAIASAIHDFFANNRMEAMQAEVRRRKQEFSWSNMVKSIETLSQCEP